MRKIIDSSKNVNKLYRAMFNMSERNKDGTAILRRSVYSVYNSIGLKWNPTLLETIKRLGYIKVITVKEASNNYNKKNEIHIAPYGMTWNEYEDKRKAEKKMTYKAQENKTITVQLDDEHCELFFEIVKKSGIKASDLMRMMIYPKLDEYKKAKEEILYRAVQSFVNNGEIEQTNLLMGACDE